MPRPTEPDPDPSNGRTGATGTGSAQIPKPSIASNGGAPKDVNLEIARLRYGLYARIVDGFRVLGWIVAASLPLLAVARVAQTVAGKNTQFTMSVSITITITIAMSVGWGATVIRSHQRKKEIDRLRRRNDILDHAKIENKYVWQQRKSSDNGVVEQVTESDGHGTRDSVEG